MKEHKLLATHFCLEFCANTNSLPWLHGAAIVLLESTCIGVGPGFFSLFEIKFAIIGCMGMTLVETHSIWRKQWHRLALFLNFIILLWIVPEPFNKKFVLFLCFLTFTWQCTLKDLGVCERIPLWTNSLTFLFLFLKRSRVRIGILLGSRSRLNTQ